MRLVARIFVTVAILTAAVVGALYGYGYEDQQNIVLCLLGILLGPVLLAIGTLVLSLVVCLVVWCLTGQWPGLNDKEV